MISGIFGNLGEGKTLLASYLAYKEAKKGRTVYANFGLPFAERLDTILRLKEVKNAFVVIDDIIPFLDSRQSQKNVFMSWILNQSRKRDVDIVYTSQVLSAVDLRLRLLTNLIFQTHLISFPVFLIEVFDCEGNLITSFKIKYEPEIYQLYDTYEIVEQKIKLLDLEKLMLECEKKSVFAHIVKSRYNISLESARVVYDLLKKKKIDLLREFLGNIGYCLI